MCGLLESFDLSFLLKRGNLKNNNAFVHLNIVSVMMVSSSPTSERHTPIYETISSVIVK